jgi:hypothetical protein
MKEKVSIAGSIAITPNGETSNLVSLGNVIFRFDFMPSGRWKVSLLRSLNNSKRVVTVGEVWADDFKIAVKEFLGFDSLHPILTTK